jgi:hypothetical protein
MWKSQKQIEQLKDEEIKELRKSLDSSYSEEEVEKMAKDAYTMGRKNILIGVFNKWFEQFKK